MRFVFTAGSQWLCLLACAAGQGPPTTSSASRTMGPFSPWGQRPVERRMPPTTDPAAVLVVGGGDAPSGLNSGDDASAGVAMTRRVGRRWLRAAHHVPDRGVATPPARAEASGATASCGIMEQHASHAPQGSRARSALARAERVPVAGSE